MLNDFQINHSLRDINSMISQIKGKTLNSLRDRKLDYMKLSERSSYHPILESLEELGFLGVQELNIGDKFVDILFEYEEEKFIVEIKLTNDDKKISEYLTDGIIQAYNYGKRVNSYNMISIVYPERYSSKIASLKKVRGLSLNLRVDILTLTRYWTDKEVLTVEDFLRKLKEKIDDNVVSRNEFEVTIKILKNKLKEISDALSQYYDGPNALKELINVFGEDYELFLSMGEFGSIEKFTHKNKFVAIDIVSYLLLNQILFYHIYVSLNAHKKATPPQIEEIGSMDELKSYFDRLNEIDYGPVYEIDVLSKIPSHSEIIKSINKTLKIIEILKPEKTRADLFGSLFHEILPERTRKVLSAFYTNSKASEILARLTIKNWDDTVIDPACGSGTLLVSAYKTKEELYEGRDDVHKFFVEENITGVDIMPFACHLASVNLSIQKITTITEMIRITRKNSLELPDIIKERKTVESSSKNLSRKIEPIKRSQTVFEDFDDKRKKKKLKNEKEKEFTITKSDIVLMNPPFCDRNKLPRRYVEEILSHKNLVERCGTRINLWGYFLALLDDVLSDNGRVGAIVPSSFLRGKETRKIRKKMLENYHIEYIIKPVGNIAFSKGAKFRDIAIILQRKKPRENDFTKVIFMKTKLEDISHSEAEQISNELRNLLPTKEYTKRDYDCYSVKYSELLRHSDNLISLLWSSNLKNLKNIRHFLESLEKKAGDKLTRIDTSWFREGIHTYPRGISKLIFVNNPIQESRLFRAFLVLNTKAEGHIEFSPKKTKNKKKEINLQNMKFRVDSGSYLPSLRTINGIRRMDSSEIHDYVLIDNYKGANDIIKTLEIPKFSWKSLKSKILGIKCNLALIHKFTPWSNNIHLLAIFMEKDFYPSDSFTILKPQNSNIERAKLMTLYFNSTLFFVYMFVNKKATEEKNIEIKQLDLAQCNILDFTKLTIEEEKRLLQLFDKIRYIVIV